MIDSVKHYIVGGASEVLTANVSDVSPFFWLSEFAREVNPDAAQYMVAGYDGALRNLPNDIVSTPTWALGISVTDWNTAETDAVWIVPETSFQYSAPSRPYPESPLSPVDVMLALIDTVQASAPGVPIAVYEDWADPTPFLVKGALTSATRNVYFDYVLGEHHRWFETLVAELQSARPELSITLIPAASSAANLVVSGEFSELALVLMPDDPEDGASARAFLAGAVSYISVYEKPLTKFSPNIDPTLGATFAELSKSVPDSSSESDGELQVSAGPDEEPSDASGRTSFTGTEAADVLAWIDTLETIDLGDGVDTLIVEASRASATLQFAKDGTILMALGDRKVPVVLSNVERLAFEDGTLAFDIDGVAGQAYRLYQASFDRTPDATGLGFWIDQLDEGKVTLTEAAKFFMTSEEFAEAYGTPEEVTDVLFLTLLYLNALDRKPDDDGFVYWRDQQKQGVTRPEMMVYFSESTENVAQVAPAIADGIWYL